MRDSFFVSDGYDFLPGDLAFADPLTAKRLGSCRRFEAEGFRLQDSREWIFGEEQVWRSIETGLTEVPLDVTFGHWTLFVAVEGEAPALRIAVGHGSDADLWENCAEYYLNVARE